MSAVEDVPARRLLQRTLTALHHAYVPATPWGATSLRTEPSGAGGEGGPLTGGVIESHGHGVRGGGRSAGFHGDRGVGPGCRNGGRATAGAGRGVGGRVDVAAARVREAGRGPSRRLDTLLGTGPRSTTNPVQPASSHSGSRWPWRSTPHRDISQPPAVSQARAISLPQQA
jgi:hypothetical protein